MKLTWHALAKEEFHEAIDFYLTHACLDIAGKFATATHKTVSLLQAHPAIGSPTHFGARRIPLQGFPFNLVYRTNAHGVIIVAIANQSRRPRYWAGR